MHDPYLLLLPPFVMDFLVQQYFWPCCIILPTDRYRIILILMWDWQLCRDSLLPGGLRQYVGSILTSPSSQAVQRVAGEPYQCDSQRPCLSISGLLKSHRRVVRFSWGHGSPQTPSYTRPQIASDPNQRSYSGCAEGNELENRRQILEMRLRCSGDC